MRFVTYRRNGEQRAGVVVGEQILDLAEGAAALGKSLPSDLVGILTLEEAGLAIAALVDFLRIGDRLPLRAHIEQVAEEVVRQLPWPFREDAVPRVPHIGVEHA